MPLQSFDYDRQNYDPAAPVVEIAVAAPGTAVPAATLVALVDSGADGTMLPVDVLNRIEARYVETRQMRGATGHAIVVDTYLVTVRLGSHTLHGIQAVAMRAGAEAIVGRDVLNQLALTLNGPAHVVLLVD